ncbi:MAG: pyruvate, water dikinase regulatory protein [Elsteraceae bacterium]
MSKSQTRDQTPKKEVHIHLVSDATGESVRSVGRACLVQFPDLKPVEHMWSLVRTRVHLERVLAGIAADPGPVLFTMVDDDMRDVLRDGCRKLSVPIIPILDPVIGALGNYLGMPSMSVPGKQHALDAEYFKRIDAMTFALIHDDGQSPWSLEDADVVLVGVSRTSKTPTCMYLANRGFKAGNIPIVPGVALPPELFTLKRPLVIGLTTDPARLVQVRSQRLRSLQQDEDADYADIDLIKAEVVAARRLFNDQGWPSIDVTRRSIEETAAAILQLLTKRQADRG